MKDTEMRALRDALEEAQTERKSLRQAVKRFEAERDAWARKLESLSQTVATLERQLSAVSDERDTLREDLRIAEAELKGLYRRASASSKTAKAPSLLAPSKRRSAGELRAANEAAAAARAARVRLREAEDEMLLPTTPSTST